MVKANAKLQSSYMSLMHQTERSQLEKLFGRAQEIAHLGVWSLIYETGQFEWSDECLRIYGLPLDRNQFTYEEWLSFIHPEDKEMIMQRISHPDADGSICFDARIVRPDQEVRYVHQVTMPIGDSDNGIFGICLDITDQVNSQVKLQLSINDLNHYKQAIDASSIVSITDEKGKITYANKKFIEVSKYSEQELLMSSHNIVNSGFHDDKFWSDFWQTIRSGKIWRGQLRNQAKDKTIYWVDTSVVPFMGEKGNIIHYIVVRHDITELQNTKDSLYQKNKDLQIALEEIELRSNMEKQKSLWGEIIFKSTNEEAMLSELSASLRDFLGTKFFATFIKDINADNAVWTINYTHGQAAEEKEYIKKGLALKYTCAENNQFSQAGLPILPSGVCSNIGVPLNSANGNVTGWVIYGCVDMDKTGSVPNDLLRSMAELVAIKISELRAAVYITRHNEILKEEVKNRTHELLEINKSLELFASTVSHDLKSPLRLISSFMDLIKKDLGETVSDSVREYMNYISNSTHSMTELITALLRFSQLDKHILNKEIFAPLSTIEYLMNKEKLSYPDKKYEISINAPYEVYADEILMRQVFENLISNAIKYSSKKELIKINIDQSLDNENVIFRITDNGAGFNSGLASKLFQTFQRLHAESEFTGHGIGLANVARIIEKHGGEIRAINNPDEGATFEFKIPLYPLTHIKLETLTQK